MNTARNGRQSSPSQAKLGIGSAQTLHNWIRKAQVDSGKRASVTTDAAAELWELRAENRELRRANEILKPASTFVAADSTGNASDR